MEGINNHLEAKKILFVIVENEGYFEDIFCYLCLAIAPKTELVHKTFTKWDWHM